MRVIYPEMCWNMVCQILWIHFQDSSTPSINPCSLSMKLSVFPIKSQPFIQGSNPDEWQSNFKLSVIQSNQGCGSIWKWWSSSLNFPCLNYMELPCLTFNMCFVRTAQKNYSFCDSWFEMGLSLRYHSRLWCYRWLLTGIFLGQNDGWIRFRP